MKRIFKLSPHWKNEEEEKWLEDMHQQGWRLTKVLFRFQFVYGQPEKVIYKRDFQPGLMKQEREEYIKLYEESGWEYVTRKIDFYYFRIAEDEVEMPDLYTDLESKVEQVKKQFKEIAVAYCGVCIASIAAYTSAFDNFLSFRVLMVCCHIVGLTALWKLWMKRKNVEKQAL
jgi:Protein of unknown function (DUF2812)